METNCIAFEKQTLNNIQVKCKNNSYFPLGPRLPIDSQGVARCSEKRGSENGAVEGVCEQAEGEKD